MLKNFQTGQNVSLSKPFCSSWVLQQCPPLFLFFFSGSDNGQQWGGQHGLVACSFSQLQQFNSLPFPSLSVFPKPSLFLSYLPSPLHNLQFARSKNPSCNDQQWRRYWATGFKYVTTVGEWQATFSTFSSYCHMYAMTVCDDRLPCMCSQSRC